MLMKSSMEVALSLSLSLAFFFFFVEIFYVKIEEFDGIFENKNLIISPIPKFAGIFLFHLNWNIS